MLEALRDTRLVGQSRTRLSARLRGRDQVATLAFGLGFLAAAAAFAAVAPPPHLAKPWLLPVLVLCHAALSRVEFELGSGVFLPTELILVPMLFLVPPPLVPLLVALGYVVGALPEVLAGGLRPERLLVRLPYSWHAIGPALVFQLAGAGAPSWSDWPVYVGALGAQFGFDAASSIGRESLGVGVPPRMLLPALGRAYLVDLLLAPVGFLAALAAAQSTLGFLPVLSLAALLAVMAWDRRQRLGEAIELTHAVDTATSIARVDQLTGLGNRLAWEEAVEALEAERIRGQRPMSVILIDLDGLKHANDTRGHAFGDVLIRTIADLVTCSAGDGNVVARFGGDELGVLVPGADARACLSKVGRIQDAIRIHPGIDGYPLSASIGAASSPPEETLAEALELADRRMYVQKRRARALRIEDAW